MKKLLIIIALLALPVSASIIDNGTQTRKFRDRTAADLDFTLSYTPTQTVVSGSSSSTTTQKDLILNHYTSATIDYGANVSASNLIGTSHGVTFSAGNGIASVTMGGVVTRISDGTAFVNGSMPNLTKQIQVPVVRTGNVTTDIFTKYADGSLASSTSNQVDSKLTLPYATTTSYMFSSADNTNYTYTRNTSFFLSGIDTTCVPAATSLSSGYSGPFLYPTGVLIGSQAMIFAHHTSVPVGMTVYFVDNSNNTRSATVSNISNVSGTDIDVAKLSNTMTGITPCKILPATYLTYLPSITATTTIPAIGFLGGGLVGMGLYPHTYRQATVRDVFVTTNVNGYIGLIKPTSALRIPYYYDNAESGDSGNPAFLVIGGQLVFLCDWYSGYAGSGPFITNYISQVNTFLSGWGLSSLSQISLSSYNSY